MINSIPPLYSSLSSKKDNIDHIKDIDTIKHPIRSPKTIK